ncbi:MAG: hypothetical protein HRO68_09965 [Nitrosopumilus sp.]|nr:hypothetical protein [Nitrosopumilus sp.]
MKAELCQKFNVHTDGYETQFGFIFPGHGMKGKQEKLDTDEDLKNMYHTHQKKRQVSFWLKCKSKAKKRSGDSNDTPQSKRQSDLVNTMVEVGGTIDKLKEIHGDKYSDLQLNCWAHMVNSNRHQSLEDAPDRSFFGKKKKESLGVSPGKKISLRSECINQLDKWHQLKERGVITEDQYAELQATILTDIKKY